MPLPLSWISGLYFLRENIKRHGAQNYLFTDIFWYSGTNYFVGNVDGRSYGLFGEASYRWNTGVGLTVGARYSRDDKDWYYAHRGWPLSGAYGRDANGNQITVPGGFDASSSGRWSAFTPNVVLDWKRNPSQYFYVKIARGYQSGGFGAEEGASSPAAAVVQFHPEFAMNHEMGAKLEFLEHRLRINPTLYWTNYTDLQILTIVPGFIATSLISNAGKARSRGAELQFTVQPVHGLEFNGAYSYLDCKISAPTVTTSTRGTPIDINGYDCRRSPKNAFNVGSRVEWGVGQLGAMFAQLDYTWTDKFFFDNDNNLISAVGSQSRLDGSLGLRSPDGRWELSLWGKNLSNQLLVSGRTALVTPDCRAFVCNAQSESVMTAYQPPRTYGLTLRWNLNAR